MVPWPLKSSLGPPGDLYSMSFVVALGMGDDSKWRIGCWGTHLERQKRASEVSELWRLSKLWRRSPLWWISSTPCWPFCKEKWMIRSSINFATFGVLPYNNYGEVQQIPTVAKIGSLVGHEAVSYDFHDAFHGEDHQKDVLDFFLENSQNFVIFPTFLTPKTTEISTSPRATNQRTRPPVPRSAIGRRRFRRRKPRESSLDSETLNEINFNPIGRKKIT